MLFKGLSIDSIISLVKRTYGGNSVFFFSSDGRHGGQPKDTEIEIIIQVEGNASFHSSTASDTKIRQLD